MNETDFISGIVSLARVVELLLEIASLLQVVLLALARELVNNTVALVSSVTYLLFVDASFL
jgi:hypothetical protein